MSIDILAADRALAARHAAHIPDLVRATGPQSYDYIFGPRADVYDAFIETAWMAPGNFFSHTQSTIAFEDGVFRGVLIGHDGPAHYPLKDALWPLLDGLVQKGDVEAAHLVALAERADIASYMNPHVPEDCHYIIVVSVPLSARGRGAGKALIENAIAHARGEGFRSVHLDVMSDNPAVGLYRAMGFQPMAETITPIPCRQHGLAMELRMVLPL